MKKFMFAQCYEACRGKKNPLLTNLFSGKFFGTALVLLVMFLVIGNSIAFAYTAWEDDRFDSLNTGSLSGQNNWAGTISASIVGDPGNQCIGSMFRSKVLYIDPGTGQTIMNSKSITSQSVGNHYIEFFVRVDDATEPSVAKLEVYSTGNTWGKKFQIYFGSTIRINYDQDSSKKIILVSATETGRWYWIRVEITSSLTLFNVYVDGELKNSVGGITMPSGPITGLGITGWDRAGTVYLDNLYGIRYN
jgi:hypothetical protein